MRVPLVRNYDLEKPFLIGYIFAVLSGIWFVIIWFNQWWELSHKYFHDDSYYYFQTAINYVQTGVMTFDQVGATDGYHPLWMWVLVAAFNCLIIFGVELNQTNVSSLVLGLGLLFQALSVYLLSQQLDLLKLRAKILAVTFLIFVSWPFYVNGMETALAMFVMIALISFLITKSVHQVPFSFYLLIPILLLTRLESIVFTPVIIFWLGIKFGRREVILGLLSVLIGGCIVFFQSYYLSSHLTYFPVSSKVKDWWATELFQEYMNTCRQSHTFFGCHARFYIQKFLGVILLLTDQLKILWVFISPGTSAHDVFPSHMQSIVSFTLLFLTSIFGVNVLSRRLSVKETNLFVIFFIATGLLLLLVYIKSFQVRSFSWYLWACFPFFLILTCLSLNQFWCKVKLIVGCLIVITISSTFTFICRSDSADWAIAYQKAVAYINEAGLSSEVGGTWAAGHVGFGVNGKVVNLEGLIAEPQVFSANKQDTLPDYIRTKKIRWILYNSAIPEPDVRLDFFSEIRVRVLRKIMSCLDDRLIYKSTEATITIYMIDGACMSHLENPSL
jgi:hypothetical protein